LARRDPHAVNTIVRPQHNVSLCSLLLERPAQALPSTTNAKPKTNNAVMTAPATYGDDGDFGGVLLARWRCLITL
jgi:hypothetical protein